MKKFPCLFLVITFFAGQHTEAQILNKIKERVTQSAENRVVNKAENATEKAMDKAEESAKGKNNGKTPEKGVEKTKVDKNNDRDTVGIPKGDQATLVAYSNYDFVPGDKLIYWYDMAGEANSEIPGRMLIDEGPAEIQTYKGEKILFVPTESSLSMHPDVKGNAYLPEQYTVEFDILSNGGVETTIDQSEIILYFREKGVTSGAYGNATAPVRITLSGISGTNATYGFEVYDQDGNGKGTSGQNFSSQALNSKQDNWRHVAIYVNKNIGKLYIDQHRIGVLNQVIPGRAAMLDIGVTTSGHPVLFKNFRIAAGGADSYNKIITDGKFIAYGIQFDVNKSNLKPESMGTINEFVKMMKEKPELKFEIGGHTDSDGTAERNKVLSQERADAVKVQMIKMGISADRLTTKGYGISKPIIDNNSPENKAKNRRVEFVKNP
jgi:outer membrane protein OmpA-like peptidoglycan-associated protein